MRYLPSLLRVQILSNDGVCLGANINKFDQMWYLLHICIDFAVVVNPFFRAVYCTVLIHAVDKVIAKVVNVANADVDVARRRFELKAIIKEY